MTQTEPAVDRQSSEQSKKSDGERYAQHVANLRRALDVGGDRLDPDIAARARSVLAGADERLALGVDHTIIALAGGTGSGKSSTFNAISRLTFADVGVRRPTTARVTACAWSDSATALLDWLEVDTERRINRDSVLDGDEASLAGLILLDLPDHDSIEPKHREIVDRILPLVDLLIWVVDPQKYADEALHAGYLQAFAGAEASMIVVLNQIDTVAESGRPALVADVARLLTEDGLVGVDVRTISAKTGEGVTELRETLREAVARRSVAASRLADELDREGRRIAEEVPATVLQSVEPLVGGEVDRVAVAVGVSAVVDDVRATVRFGGDDARVPAFRAPQESAIRVIRSRWVTKVSEGMRPAWAESVDRAVPDQDWIAAALGAALDLVPISTERSVGARRARLLGWIAGGVTLAGALVTLAFALGLVDVADTWTLVAALVTVVAALVSVGALTIGARIRANLAEQRAEEVRTAAFGALRDVVETTLAEPAQRVLTEHRDVRESALSARDTSSTGRRSVPVPTATA
ncbi:GTP-binding protein EngB required for normal cell division [Sanguibacter gelidistatuariae]|uniref:GTP-binding protein EngB required for normal cell division n=1 Tax=Sanguibacter gelidistatuariae TaxID=1814289 RepID=A0A1G6N6H7_9MICO|nr:GTP-binding protein [Sanguibacter gelidistatuariae]SDC63281.1 GTP-binding protein EngB required for normal cell division [Sanguibacter gelidistatuariae]